MLCAVKGGAPTQKRHPAVNTKHHPVEDDSRHHSGTSRPAWLLALEIVTGIMVGSLLLVVLVSSLKKCKSKPSMIIPWKKSASEKDYMAIYIGLCAYLPFWQFDYLTIFLVSSGI